MSDLYTITAGGFTAHADAFALESRNYLKNLWFLSMVGPQTSLKAIRAALLLKPPKPAHLYSEEDRERFSLTMPDDGQKWTTKLVRLPSGAYHGFLYSRLAEHGFKSEDFVLISRDPDSLPQQHRQFLQARTHIPIHPSWDEWLWNHALRHDLAIPLESVGVHAYRCSTEPSLLMDDITEAIQFGTIPNPAKGGLDVPRTN